MRVRPSDLARPPARPARRDRGSMAVEFVIAGPALVLLLLLVSAGGQWLNLSGDVGAAARDSVRAASFARSTTKRTPTRRTRPTPT